MMDDIKGYDRLYRCTGVNIITCYVWLFSFL